MGDGLGPEGSFVLLALLATVAVRRASRPPPPADHLLRIRTAVWVRAVGWIGATILVASSLCVVVVAVLLPELELRLAIAEALGVLLLIDAFKGLSGCADLIVTRHGLHFLGFRCAWNRLAPRRGGAACIGPFGIRRAGLAGLIGAALDPLWWITPREEACLILYRRWLGTTPPDGSLHLRVRSCGGPPRESRPVPLAAPAERGAREG